MKSRIAKESENALVEATQRLSPEERLNAFLNHSRLLAQLREATTSLRPVGPEPRRP